MAAFIQLNNFPLNERSNYGVQRFLRCNFVLNRSLAYDGLKLRHGIW